MNNNTMTIEYDENLTLEQIEHEPWKSYQYETALIAKCHGIRKKPIIHFTVEDFRILISQQISLTVLIPFAINILENNIFAEGAFYEGDLLESI